jgi:hypothetical protein
MRRKSKHGDKELLEMDADLASLYESVERCKLDKSLERAIMGTHLAQLAGIWFDVVKDSGNYESFTDEVLLPGTIIEFSAIDDYGEPQGNAIAILGWQQRRHRYSPSDVACARSC